MIIVKEVIIMFSHRMKITATIALAMFLIVSGIAVCTPVLDKSNDTDGSGAVIAALGDAEYYHVHLYANYPGATPEYHVGSDARVGLDFPIYDQRELNYIMQDEGWGYEGHKVVSLNTKADGTGRSFELGDLVIRDEVPSLVDADGNINLYMIWGDAVVHRTTQELDEKDTSFLAVLGIDVFIAILIFFSLYFPRKK